MNELYHHADMDVEKAKETAEAHAEWFCQMIKPLLVSFGIHFYGHGWNDAKEEISNEKD